MVFDSRRLATIVALLGLPLGCTSDLAAPECYNNGNNANEYCALTTAGGTDGDGTGDGGPLNLDCTDIPNAALLAAFDYTAMASGSSGSLDWSASELPEGLSIDTSTGQITGTPAAAGDFEFELTASDGEGNTSAATCALTVNEALEPDLDELLARVPGCIRGADTLLDVLIEGTGDGSSIACDAPEGAGNGRLPAGITIGRETCAIEGTLAEDALGTYVFIVRGEQSGREVFVPYCVTNETPGGYALEVDHSGLGGMGVDATLLPVTRRYDPSTSFTVDDASVQIESPSSCGANSCFYGFAFSINASGFDADTFAIQNDRLVDDETTQEPIGFAHDMTIAGPNPGLSPELSQELNTRPWVVNIGLDYCLADNQPDCDGADAVRQNGDASLEFGIIMMAQ